MYSLGGLVPVNAVAVAAALVVFEVGEKRRLDGDVEVVGFVRSHRHEACAHGEAVQVARDGAVHVCEFVRVEVVA